MFIRSQKQFGHYVIDKFVYSDKLHPEEIYMWAKEVASSAALGLYSSNAAIELLK